MGRDIDKRHSHRVGRKKQSEPFIQIGSVILNSAAYTDLSFSARSMLIEVLNYYNGRNNGAIFLSTKVLNARGFSKNTATKALKELRSHGFLYMTKRGGNITGGCSWFAITWRPINKVEGQNLSNFQHHAYKNWIGVEKNNRSEIGLMQNQELGIASLDTAVNNFGDHTNQSLETLVISISNHRICDL